MATMLSQKLVEAQEANDTVKWFLRKFEVGKLLGVCRAHKAKGFSVVELFTYLLGCMFSPISTYMSMRIGSFREAFSKIRSIVSVTMPESTGIRRNSPSMCLPCSKNPARCSTNTRESSLI